MVHARFGGKDAILDDFLQEYVKHLSPDPASEATGLEQVVAHIDRIRELHTADSEVLRAMFVATFEAAKTTSPLRDRVRGQLTDGVAKVAAGVRKGMHDKSIRNDIDPDRAVGDISAAVFGIAFLWIALPPGFDLDRELAHARARIIHDYGT